MEDDEFGDLYTDVISTFSAPPPPVDTNLTPTAAATTIPPVSLNLNLSPPNPIINDGNFSPSCVSQDPSLQADVVSESSPPDSVDAAKIRVLENRDLNLNLNAEEEGDGDCEPVIPGVSIPRPEDDAPIPNGVPQEQMNDDWDSDSDDDLQILLNENGQPDIHQFQGPGVLAENGGNDDDEDGEPLVIVAPSEEQGWGEEAAAEGERKEGGEAGKVNGGVSMAPKQGGYNNYGYHHPFHSQFKYVRPGATPLPGGSGGAGQVRPPVNMGVVGGRGRGDWRPAGMKGSLQKGFQSGFWGSNASGRGSGADFILPSQKNIFDISIDSFEDKPWNHPGSDVSDFFNFELNEDSWKEYCKKLEQLRMESTMKNRAHVLVVGSQSEQEYDPDLPPELAAAAAGIQNPSVENLNARRADFEQRDVAKGTALMRPPQSIGRPIQVETGSGERFPSMDTRPPRMRDLDTVIEIVLQGSVDDESSAGCGAINHPDNDASREDHRDDEIEEDGEQTGNGYSDGSPQSLDRIKREDNARSPRGDASHDSIPDDESSSPPKAPIEHSPGSRENSTVYPSDKFNASHEERQMEGNTHERSRSTSPVESARDGKFADGNKQEESDESMEGKDTPQGLSFEERVISDDETFQIEGNNQMEKEDVKSGDIVSSSSLDPSKHRSMRKLKLGSQVEYIAAKEIADVGHFKAASDNSRATGSSQDLPKGHNVVNEKGILDEHSSRPRDLKRTRREIVQSHHRKDRDGSFETGKNNMVARSREGSYHRDLDPYSPHSLHIKSDEFDRRRERDYADGMLQQRGEDPHGRMYRTADPRKHDHADGMIARYRGKVKEVERSNKDEYLPSRKLLENGNRRGLHHEKDVGFRIKEKDDILKTRYENMNDPHIKRRKDDEHARRDHFDPDAILRAHRDNSSQRKRDRDGSMDQRKRDDQNRREGTDAHRPVRPKDEILLQRERVEQRHRERDDGFHSKLSYEESLLRREREDGRGSIRSGRNVENNGRMGHSRKDEYKGYDRDGSYKDTGRNGEQLKRKDRVQGVSTSQFGYEEKRSRKENPTGRIDRAIQATDNQRVHERRPKENARKPKQVEVGQQSISNFSEKPHEEKSGRNEMAGMTGTTEDGNAECGISAQLQTTREKMEDASDDNEQNHSKRGRSKLERWASHEERNSSINSKASSSLKVDAEKDNPGSERSAKASDGPAKKSQAVDTSQSAAVEGKDSEFLKEKEADMKQMEDRHLDTVEKLKKRSERFKLPMPSEKDTTTVKKTDTEPLSSVPSEALADSEMKRPPRKRRWISK